MPHERIALDEKVWASEREGWPLSLLTSGAVFCIKHEKSTRFVDGDGIR